LPYLPLFGYSNRLPSPSRDEATHAAPVNLRTLPRAPESAAAWLWITAISGCPDCRLLDYRTGYEVSVGLFCDRATSDGCGSRPNFPLFSSALCCAITRLWWADEAFGSSLFAGLASSLETMVRMIYFLPLCGRRNEHQEPHRNCSNLREASKLRPPTTR